jgi:imidazoleglycerol phosphate synthase glutamine amidotransferase subunit HisH
MLVNTVIKDRIAYVEMCSGKHFNCLSEDMCHELIEAIQDAYAKECVGIVLEAEVNRNVWSAGHDIHELPQDGSDPLAFYVPMEKLLREVQDGDCVYFVHSFYARPGANTIATAEYGTAVTAAVADGNVMGCQFHPEKSGEVGLKILRAFCEMEAVS